MRPLRSPSSAAFHDQQWSLDVERCSTWVCIGVTTKMQISMLAIRKRSRQPGKWNDPGRRAPAAGRLRRHTPALGIGTPPARGAAVTWHRGDQMGTRGCRSRRLRVDFNNPIGWALSGAAGAAPKPGPAGCFGCPPSCFSALLACATDRRSRAWDRRGQPQDVVVSDIFDLANEHEAQVLVSLRGVWDVRDTGGGAFSFSTDVRWTRSSRTMRHWQTAA